MGGLGAWALIVVLLHAASAAALHPPPSNPDSSAEPEGRRLGVGNHEHMHHHPKPRRPAALIELPSSAAMAVGGGGGGTRTATAAAAAASASLRARFERTCPFEGGGVRHIPEVPVPNGGGSSERWRPHNSTLTDLRRQTPAFRAVVWQPDPATGLGNSLQGSTSAYLYSLFSGRELFVGRTTMTETLCTAFDCGFTLVSLPRDEWADQSKHFTWAQLRTKRSPMAPFNSPHEVIRAHDYQWTDFFWWDPKTKPGSELDKRRECIYRAFGCKARACVHRVVLRFLLPNPRPELLRLLTHLRETRRGASSGSNELGAAPNLRATATMAALSAEGWHGGGSFERSDAGPWLFDAAVHIRTSPPDFEDQFQMPWNRSMAAYMKRERWIMEESNIWRCFRAKLKLAGGSRIFLSVDNARIADEVAARLLESDGDKDSDEERARGVYRVPSPRVHLGKVPQLASLAGGSKGVGCRTCAIQTMPLMEQRLLNMLDFFLLSRSKRVMGLRLSVDDSTFVMGKGVSTFANVAVMLGSADFEDRHHIMQGDRARYAKRKPRASCAWGEGARNTKDG